MRLQTSIERARRLGRLLDQPEPAATLETSKAGQQAPVIAKITSAISAGDYAPKTAKLMAITGGALTETGQTVQVRHVGEGAVAANTIVIPEPCGRLGLCFVRQNAGTPVVTTPVNRYQRVVGPISDDLERADLSWQIGQQTFPSSNLIANGTYGYFAALDFGSTPDGYDSALRPYWTRYLEPMRFRVHSHSDGWWGGSANANSQSAAKPSPLNQLMWGIADVGISMKTVGANAHISPMTLSGVAPHAGGFFAFNSDNSSFTKIYETEVTHARIWIDEVDMTGVYAVGQRMFAATLTNRVYPGDQLPLKAISAAVYEFKSVWFDLWIRIKATSLTGTVPVTQQIIWVNSNGNFRPPTFYYADPNANRAPTDDYEFTLSSAGPGSATTITTADGQTYWSVMRSAFSMSVTYTGGGPQGAVYFNWGRETPWLQLYLSDRAGNPGGANGWAIYFPEDSTDYEAIVFSSGYQFKRGVWDPNGTTTFRLAAVQIQGVWTYRYSELIGTMENYFTPWPQTITVEKL